MARSLVVALTAAVVLVCAASSGASGTAQTYSDPQGDQQGTAPDVTTIAVSHDASGTISWRIDVANQPSLTPESEVVLWIDSDRNPSTGAPNTLGSEYVFLVQADGFSFARWDGSDFDFDTPGTTVSVSYSAGATIVVNRSELGNTTGFNFWVRGLRETGPETADIDDAPNDGTFAYVLTPAGPRHGSVASATITRVGNGMRARFVFRALPVEGSRVRVVWRVNGKAYPQRGVGVVRSITATARVGRGLYVAQLQVRPPGAAWRTVASVRRRL